MIQQQKRQSNLLTITPDTGFPPTKKLHMIGIGGCGMSPLAHMLVSLGHKISGSDVAHSQMIEHLREEGVEVFIGHKVEHVGQPDVVVHSSAISEENPELAYARSQGIPVMPRSQLLAELMDRQHGIVVAGSHGKTSTTGLIFWGLHQLGQQPSTVFGGKFAHEKSSARLGNGSFMVVESDESDGSFLRLRPTVSVLTNIDHEHVGRYGSFSNLIKAFKSFVQLPPFYGFSVVPTDCTYTRRFLEHIHRPVMTYGLSERAHFRVDPQTLPWSKTKRSQSNTTGRPSHVKVIEKGGAAIDVAFCPRADHEVRNFLAAYTTLRGLGFSSASLKDCFSGFPGIQRRMEVVANVRSITVISDYAHHPTELEATLQGIRNQYGDMAQSLCLVFQPHRYSRFLKHAKRFFDIIKNVPSAVILPVFGAAEDRPETFDAFWQRWISQLQKRVPPCVEVTKASDAKTLHGILDNVVKPPAIVVFCGAGDNHELAFQYGEALAEMDHGLEHDSARAQHV